MKCLVLLVVEVIYFHNVNSMNDAIDVGPVIFVNLVSLIYLVNSFVYFFYCLTYSSTMLGIHDIKLTVIND